MSFYKYEEMSWEEINNIPKDKTILFLPISPIEEHGTHLPVGTDYFGAMDIANMAGQLLIEKKPELNAIIFPGIPLGCASVTEDFPGTVSIPGTTINKLTNDILSSFAKNGFQYIVISNHHLDPIHMKALLTAIEDVIKKYNIKIIETASRIVYSNILTKEMRAGQNLGLDMTMEIHADIKETSYIKYCYPSLIKKDIDQISAVSIDVDTGFKKGLTTFKQMGAENGYIGSPNMATEELGRLHLEEGAQLTADLALKLINNEKLPEINEQMIFILENFIKLN